MLRRKIAVEIHLFEGEGFVARDVALTSSRFANMKGSGMFLYAKLVIRNVMSQDNLYDIRNEMDHLPNGLDQA